MIVVMLLSFSMYQVLPGWDNPACMTCTLQHQHQHNFTVNVNRVLWIFILVLIIWVPIGIVAACSAAACRWFKLPREVDQELINKGAETIAD